MPAPIVLLTDFGTRDVYVGVMKGVIAGIVRHAPVIDLTHEVPPQDLRTAACSLLFSYPYFPVGSVFCCVVDPGVGTAREPVVLELEGEGGLIYVVCPDNGLATPLLDRVRRAVVLDDPAFHLPRASATFHGRDVFAPASAHLASGVSIERLGSRKEPGALVSLDWPQPTRQGDGWRAQVIHVDHFGNLVTNLAGEAVSGDGREWRVHSGSRTISGISPTFAAVPIGEPVAYVGSSGYLELAIRQGSAAAEWQARVDDEIVVE